MTTLSLITMVTVQVIVTLITAWFLIQTLRKPNDQNHDTEEPTNSHNDEIF